MFKVVYVGYTTSTLIGNFNRQTFYDEPIIVVANSENVANDVLTILDNMFPHNHVSINYIANSPKIKTMKREIYWWLASAVSAVIVFLFINTTPSDDRCIAMTRQAMMAHTAGDNIIGVVENSVLYNKYTVAVENDVFYKKIYSKYDGHVLGIGILNQVIVYK